MLTRAKVIAAMTVEHHGKPYFSNKVPPSVGPITSPSEYMQDHKPATTE